MNGFDRIAQSTLLLGIVSGCCASTILPSIEQIETWESTALDLSAWFAYPVEDVDGDGARDFVLFCAQKGEAGSTNPGISTWILSGQSLQPICRLTPATADIPQGIVFVQAVLDRDGDGIADLGASVIPIDQARSFFASTAPQFIVSARSAKVVEIVWPTDVQAASDTIHVSESKDWSSVHVIRMGEHEWMSGWDAFASVEGSSLAPESLTRRCSSRLFDVRAAHPQLDDPKVGGDLDGDGVLDWLGLTSNPPSVVIVSGADLSQLRSLSVSPAPMATAATGGFDVGDVDGDGVRDWIVGAHVSQSEGRIAPRTCRLGLITLVSGADLRVIATLERQSFLAGPALTCPIVRLADRADDEGTTAR